MCRFFYPRFTEVFITFLGDDMPFGFCKILSWDRDSFTFTYPFCVALISFSCLTVLSSVSSAVAEHNEGEHCYLISSLGDEIYSFFTTECDFASA